MVWITYLPGGGHRGTRLELVFDCKLARCKAALEEPAGLLNLLQPADATKAYKLFVHSPLYCLALTSKGEKKSFTENFYIIRVTHAKSLTSFLKHQPHFSNFEDMFIGNSRNRK